MPDFGNKCQSRDFPAVHAKMVYRLQLPNECRDFAELCFGKAPYPPIHVVTNSCDIVHRPLYREFDAAIPTTFHVDEPERASMNIYTSEQVFPQLGRIL